MEEESKLEELKDNYRKIQKQYGLPSFEEMNRDFNMERASEVETDYLIREIRKFVWDKFSTYLRFAEAILNPVNVQMFIFSFIKSLDEEDKKKIQEIYRLFSKKELQVIELDVSLVEEKEAEFVKESYKLWQETKKDLLDILDKVKKNWDNKFKANNKSYFG